MTKQKQEVPQEAAQEPTYSKTQFLSSGKFTGAQKDVLAALLQDGESLTYKQAVEKMNEFLKREV